jgi:hypothetical protein
MRVAALGVREAAAPPRRQQRESDSDLRAGSCGRGLDGGAGIWKCLQCTLVRWPAPRASVSIGLVEPGPAACKSLPMGSKSSYQ